VRGTRDEPGRLEAVDGVRDAGLVHLQPRPDRAHRQRPTSAEEQQHEDLVAGEGHVEGLEHRLDPRQRDLVRAHEGGDRGHAVGGVAPAVLDPLPVRLGDRVRGEAWRGLGHDRILAATGRSMVIR
jgi:hypothetical protein